MAHKGIGPLYARPLLFMDLETTGLNNRGHEIIEFGVIRVNPETLVEVDRWEARVAPLHIETAESAALAVNGYWQRIDQWRDAIPLRQAMDSLVDMTHGTILFACNVSFEVGFLEEAVRQTGVQMEVPYPAYDVLTLGYRRFRNAQLVRGSVDELSVRLGLGEEDKPHCALTGAQRALELFRLLC